jgi:NAD(P)-dependent dehydrogenase (short-subunit alcohol dehydrogenase family)
MAEVATVAHVGNGNAHLVGALAGQRIVIIGGTSGIGLATARELGAAGASVVIAGRSRERLEAALAQLRGDASGAALDATDLAALRAFYAELDRFDHLVVTLSSGGGAGPFRSLELGELRQGFEGKFWPYLMAIQAALPTLSSDGSITMVTAASARSSIPGTAGVAAINGALEAMVRPLSVELQPTRVNAVSPGVIDTPWWDRVLAEQRARMHAHSAAAVPVGRVGQPEDVARAIRFLVESTFVTGTVVECHGGPRLA